MRRARIRFCLLLGGDPCIKLFLLCLDYGVDTGCIQCIQEFRHGGFGIDRTTDQARNILVVNIGNGAHLSGNAGSVKHKAKERAALRFLVVLQLQLDIGNICANRLVLQTLGADNAGAECCGVTNGSSILSIGVCPVVSVRLYIVNALFAIQEGIDEVFIRPQAVNHLHGCFRHLAGAGNAKVNVNGSGIKVEIVQNFALQVVTGGQAQHCTGRIAAVSVNGGEAAARAEELRSGAGSSCGICLQVTLLVPFPHQFALFHKGIGCIQVGHGGITVHANTSVIVGVIQAVNFFLRSAGWDGSGWCRPDYWVHSRRCWGHMRGPVQILLPDLQYCSPCSYPHRRPGQCHHPRSGCRSGPCPC